MNQDRDQQKQSQQGSGDSKESQSEPKHPSPFKETAAGNETENDTQEESNLEQERKEAMTERD